MALNVGQPVPWFYGPTEGNPKFCFDSVAGRYVVLTLLGSAGRNDSRLLLQSLARHRQYFDDAQALFFGVTIDPQDDTLGRVRDQVPGIRFLRDFDQTISRLYGALPAASAAEFTRPSDGEMIAIARAVPPAEANVAAALLKYQPFSLILDERLRVLAVCRVDEPEVHFDRIVAFLNRQPVVPAPVRASVQAPVLIVPRVFEPDFCRSLIDLYNAHGGEDSGFMREENGRTVGVIDYAHKRRSDLSIEDETIRRQCMVRIHDRLVPEIFKAYQFRATRMERYIVACYEAANGGHFRAHRDNTTRGTAHRRFAVSLSLNADEYSGGDLRFPEFGNHLYRAPTGGAVVFSCSLLHEATPVTQGTRFVFLPFLYDDAAADLRERYAHFLSGTMRLPDGSRLPSP
ncbi:redoxin domain-containing protein [bacterium]|nr:redoxin domain-containing protein [bacterium]